jgi:Fe-S cluster biogenesis protein NfuA
VIRSSLKSGIKKVLGLKSPEAAPPPVAPAWRTDATVPGYPKQTAPTPEVEVAAAPVAPAPAPAPVVPEPVAAPVAAPVVAVAAEPPTDVVGPALSLEAIQEVMDEMVRPALQGDGGDITLIKVENNDVYVKLVGSCSTCPSSIMTMKMGVEALLKEEFPAMGQLIQVD